jgi:hypothetical protein
MAVDPEFGLKRAQTGQESTYVERVIGTIRRECLDHVIVLNEASLYRHVKSFLAYYHESRTHLSLAKDPPDPRSPRSSRSKSAVTFRRPTGSPPYHLKIRERTGMRMGGFGMFIAQELIDEVIYNQKGNEVILIKHLD